MSQDQPARAANVEGPEPSVGVSTVPVWLIVAMGALVFWGSAYLDGHAGGFSREVFEPFTSQAEIASLQPYDPERAFLAKGEFVFNQTCKACHQDNGLGKPGQYPPLAGSDWLLAPSPARIGRIVLRGLGGSIRVEGANGTYTGNGAMTPWADVYDDEHLAAVLSYVRTQWGNNAPKIKPEDIKAIRAATASHSAPFTPDELMQIPLQPPK
ncbi:MAG: cytochrome c [Verrucomicrobiota bacterium]|jgi:mono/diheme cytochrome c family protein